MPEKSVSRLPSKLVRKIPGPSACAARRRVRTIMVQHRKIRTKNHNGKSTRPSGILALGGFMSRKPWLFLLCVVGVVALTSCTGARSDSTSEIVIGEFGSLTGTTATFGISTKNGIDMAVDDLNKAGGLLGKKVRVIVEDDQGKPEEAQTVVTKLITKDQAAAILGEVASSRTMAAAPAAQQNGIPLIAPSSTTPKVTQIGDYIFRVCFIDPFQGLVMAKFATNTLKVKKVAILRDIKNDYSVGLAEVFVDNFKKMGGNIVANESYSEGDTDFS